MDVIGHQMAFFDLAFAPPRQFMEHVAQTLSCSGCWRTAALESKNETVLFSGGKGSGRSNL